MHLQEFIDTRRVSKGGTPYICQEKCSFSNLEEHPVVHQRDV